MRNLFESICFMATEGKRAWRTFSIRANTLRGGIHVSFLVVEKRRLEALVIER